MDLLISLSEERLASRSPSPEREQEWLTRVVSYPSSSLHLLAEFAPPGLCGRTSQESCRLTEERSLEPSSGVWHNSGMGSPTGFLTLNTPEYHSGAVASSLSDILETGDLPQRYFLSATVCREILRRAEKCGKEVPTALRRALEQVARE